MEHRKKVVQMAGNKTQYAESVRQNCTFGV
jgi:hypothetical protein